VNWGRQEASHGGESIPLTAKEVGMLRLFVENKGRVLTRDVILEKVWSETYITDRTIDSHVKELRKKIPPLTRLLKTVYGSGYRLDI
jgi:DNA-binding response OmpR family regulator